VAQSGSECFVASVLFFVFPSISAALLIWLMPYSLVLGVIDVRYTFVSATQCRCHPRHPDHGRSPRPLAFHRHVRACRPLRRPIPRCQLDLLIRRLLMERRNSYEYLSAIGGSRTPAVRRSCGRTSCRILRYDARWLIKTSRPTVASNTAPGRGSPATCHLAVSYRHDGNEPVVVRTPV